MNRETKKKQTRGEYMIMAGYLAWIAIFVAVMATNPPSVPPESFKILGEFQKPSPIAEYTILLHNSEYIFRPIHEVNRAPETQEELYNSYVEDICRSYPRVDPYVIESQIWHESRYISTVSNGQCVGLMQVSTYWHADRAARLGVTDFYDPYSNILLGVDLMDELLDMADGDIGYALMLYNMNHNDARQLYLEGRLNIYAESVLERADQLRSGDIV